MSAYAKIKRTGWSSDWVVDPAPAKTGKYVTTWKTDDVLVRKDSVVLVTEDEVFIHDSDEKSDGKYILRCLRFNDDLVIFTNLSFDEIEAALNG